MILPLLSTGLKIFQATRGKASSGSEMASKIVGKKTTVTGKGVGRPKSGAIVKASSNKISGANFLQSTTDPSKDKIKAKDGILEGFASIINVINKFLSSILTTLIADNKLTQKQSENERRAGELDLKRQRESSLEKDQDTGGVPSSKSKSKRSSFFDRIINFISAIIIGSLVLSLYRNFTRIIQFFKETYETIVGFFDKLGEYMSPLWEVFKFIAKFSSPLLRLTGTTDLDYAKKIEDEEVTINDALNNALSGEKENTDAENLTPKILQENNENLTSKILQEDNENLRSANNMLNGLLNMFMSPAAAGTLEGKPIRQDRTFAKEMIKTHEGLSLVKYLDSKGKPTIGYGHLIDETDPDLMALPVGGKISKERADELFDKDFNEHLLAAQKIPGFFKSSRRQQAALIDLTFNMGPNWYKGFPSFTKAFAAGDYEEAARQIEFADPVNKPGVKSGYVQDVGPRRSTPIIDLLQDKNLDGVIHLKEIEKLLGDQSSKLNDLSTSIASISMNEEDVDDSPIIVPIPKSKTKVVGGSGGNQMIVVGGEDVNSTMDKIYLAKQARVG